MNSVRFTQVVSVHTQLSTAVQNRHVFLSIKISQASGILNHLNALDMLIAYIVIIVTAIATLIGIYKLLKK